MNKIRKIINERELNRKPIPIEKDISVLIGKLDSCIFLNNLFIKITNEHLEIYSGNFFIASIHLDTIFEVTIWEEIHYGYCIYKNLDSR